MGDVAQSSRSKVGSKLPTPHNRWRRCGMQRLPVSGAPVPSSCTSRMRLENLRVLTWVLEWVKPPCPIPAFLLEVLGPAPWITKLLTDYTSLPANSEHISIARDSVSLKYQANLSWKHCKIHPNFTSWWIINNASHKICAQNLPASNFYGGAVIGHQYHECL